MTAALQTPLLRRHHLPHLVGAALVVVYLVFLAVEGTPFGDPASDSTFLIKGVHTAVNCVRNDTFTHCGQPPGLPFTDVGPYPPLQYIPAGVMLKLGLTDSQTLRGLHWLSFVSFVGILGLLAVGARRLRWPGWTPLLVVAVLSSPMLYQSTSSFGESFAALAMLSCVVAAMWRRPLLLGLAAFAAGMSKETAFPFLILLVLAVGRKEEDTWPPARVLVPAGIGLTAAVIANSALNVLRFGTPRNVNYLIPYFQTPWSQRPKLMAGLWVGTNVGLLFFATLATMLVVGSGVVAIRSAKAQPRQVGVWGPPALVAAVVVGFTVLLSSWWAPLGWDAYGSRLFMPVLPAAVLAAVLTAERPLLIALRWVTIRPFRRAAFAVGIALVGLPQFASPWTWSNTIHTLKAPTPVCENTNLAADTISFYRCMQRTVWRLEPLALRATLTKGDWRPKAGMGLLGLGTMSLTYGVGQMLARRPLRERSPDSVVAAAAVEAS